ncbi:bifunctional diaminohydroxyphosphoribosylaminopyrimidine deaminase/5-amino-6-(5-phosphoribosylamino)uracil reductase RibD [Aestuariibacter sp. GS-14]|uniref:bifunctional diaminohydroxyphosphoribosylaminopyrimidine deaminase/5-amino-6-(5-phosphoribosylamino)uracil reductase RibD n=1 Tax=Aestuariibacter sp. GS-14 TaxID=2590670 RepID=UPI00112B9082|nr:bifunctional diaminohydroxyphosphoribosylaminopyrimidine deaminase/5-amino-6-(5-phosphoribosylamino)uracil reductase RibD [Aestuariibacter sp. GS-14]TPV53727.1 bifunctional diaminohydroxyphosphoribosylaminopyrimidine deaminase/5-amino-6-(5-phosphoribosylamino)uracil reductase RibD [Aestuariibacter sp. GS-14]
MSNPIVQYSDEYWMAHAIQQARRGMYTTSPNPRVGCVIVKNNVLVGAGAHLQAGTPHAEVHALRDAGEQARGATAYVTLEPCSHTGRTPPCADALVKANVGRVVVAMTDPNPLVSGRGIKRLQDAGIVVTQGVLTSEAEALNPGFIKRMTTGMPWMRAKLACSLDGKIALANGVSQWITGPAARKDVQRFRAQSCAVLTGSGTVKADNPSLLVRPAQAELSDYPLTQCRQPLRVVIDTEQQLTPDLAMFNDGSPVLLVINGTSKYVFANAVTVIPAQMDTASQKVSLTWLIEELGRRGLNDIWVEAGAGLAGALLADNLIDELIVYQAPKVLGDKGMSMLTLPLYQKINQAPHLKLTDLRHIAEDIRMTYQVIKPDTHTAAG